MIILRKILNKFKFLIDVIFCIILTPSSIIMLVYRRFGSHKLPFSKKILNFYGVFPLTDHYYEPQFNYNKLSKDLFRDRNLPGINLNINQQLNNLSNLIYKNELIELNLPKKTPNYNFSIKNNFFENGDAEIYYQIIRHLKPRNILEIGSALNFTSFGGNKKK